MRAPCQICPRKNNSLKHRCPNVNQPRGLVRKTPSDGKLPRSNSKGSPSCARRAYLATTVGSVKPSPSILPP